MNEVRLCEQCHGELPGNAPEGLCPKCLLKLGGVELGISVRRLEVPAEASRLGAEHRRFGNYDVLEKIGQGGMGAVYKARQLNLDRIVALKLLPFGPFSRSDLLQRFRSEASAAAALQHPNIVAVHDVGEHNGQHFFSMDFVAGQTLAEVVRDQPLPAKRAAGYLKTIAEAVHYAHQHGILHRDLKPSNILIDSVDQPRITDFGLAKKLTDSELSTLNPQLTLTGQVLGSPNFMSPEQATGSHAIGPASDIYSLGALLYHLLTRQPPFQADTLTTLLKQVIETEPVAPRLLNPTIPRDLETICLKCLEKEPPRRYPTAQGLAEDLGRFLDDKPIQAQPVGAAGKAWKWCRRKPALATAIGAVVLVASVGFVGILTQWRRAAASELLARQNAYAADMNLAQRALEANDVGLAVRLLDQYRPGGKAESRKQKAKIDLRHWEWRYLWQLCQPDESVRLQTNSGAIRKVAISDDGKVMAAQTGADKIALWDLTTKQPMTPLAGRASIGAFALSATGHRLAVSTGNARGEPTVEVWDVNGPALRKTLNQPTPVRSLAFSPDETLLATFGSTGKVAVVEWASNRALTNLLVRHPRTGGAGLVAFLPDGSRLAIGEDYGRMSLLNWRTGTLMTLTNLTRGAEAVTALAFSTTTGRLAAGFGPIIRFWDADSGQLRGQLTNQTGRARALAFSADGQLVALASSDRTIRVLRVSDQEQLRCLRGHAGEGLALAFRPDGKTLVSGCRVGTACFWDVTATHRPSGHTSLEISYGLDAKAEPPLRGFAREALDPKVVSRFGLTFAHDGQSFITTDPDGFVGVWDTKSVQRTETLSVLGSNNWGVALSPDDHWLAVGHAAGKVHVWDWTQRHHWTERDRVAGFEVPFEWTGRLHFSRSGRFLWALVTFNDWTTRFRVWRTGDWQEMPLGAVDAGGFFWADFAPDDRSLATGHISGAVKLWNFPSGRHEITFTNQAAAVCAVFFSPDGRRLVSTSWDGTVRLRDLFAHRQVAALQGHSLLWGAAFSPDGRRVATGGQDAREAVSLWDLAAQREVLTLQGEGWAFVHVAFSPDGSTLMATSFEGVAHLWRAPSWEEIEAAEKKQGIQ